MRRAIGFQAVLISLALTGGAAAQPRILDVIRSERRAADPRYDLPEGWTAPGRPSVALALSGGGGWGLAHLGILQALFDDGVEIDAVAGTSIGALVGGLLCAGYGPDEIERIVRGKNWDELISGLDVRRRVLTRREELYRNAQLSIRLREGRKLRTGALAESRALERELYRYLLRPQLESGGDFDALRYPFRPVATDVRTGARVAPRYGSLVAAVGGSFSVPGVFRPVPFGEALLIDGGLVENIPAETARTMGSDLVIAVDLSARIDPSADVGGAADLLGRSIAIMSAPRDEELRAMADLVIAPEVREFPRSSFGVAVDELVRVGRSAYRDHREAIWKLLEEAVPDGRHVDFGRVAVECAGCVEPEELVERLGGAPGRITRFRVAAELTRLLNEGPFRDGRVEWVEEAHGERVLRFVLEGSAPVTRVVVDWPAPSGPRRPIVLEDDRYSPALARDVLGQARRQLTEAGHVLARLEALRWLPDEARLEVRLVDEPVLGIETRAEGKVRLERTQTFFRGLAGERFNFDGLVDRLDEMVARGAVEEWWLTPARTGDGVQIEVHLEGDDYLELAGSLTYRGDLGFAGFARGAKSNISGRGDFADLVIEAGRDVLAFQGRYRTEYGLGYRNVGGEVGARYFNNVFLAVDDDQDLVEQLDEEFSGERAWLAVFRRLRVGGVGRMGVFRERIRFDPTADAPREEQSRTSVVVGFELNRHEKLLFPERGFALELEGEHAVSGWSLWRAEASLDAAFPVDRERAQVITLRLDGGLSDGAQRRPYWFNPGGYRELYGFLPYGAASPQYARGGLRWRYRWLDFSLARVYVEVGTDWISTAAERRDLGESGTWGYGASIVGNVRFLGPISVGYAGNDAGADVFFVTAGFPFPAE